MDRRTFLGTLAGALLPGLLAVEAQHRGKAAMAKLGMLLTGAPSDTSQSRELDAFKTALGSAGWVDGRTISMSPRRRSYAECRRGRFRIPRRR